MGPIIKQQTHQGCYTYPLCRILPVPTPIWCEQVAFFFRGFLIRSRLMGKSEKPLALYLKILCKDTKKFLIPLLLSSFSSSCLYFLFSIQIIQQLLWSTIVFRVIHSLPISRNSHLIPIDGNLGRRNYCQSLSPSHLLGCTKFPSVPTC